MSIKTEIVKNNGSMCLHAWQQIHVTPIGVVKPCCIFDGPLKNKNNKTIRINDEEINGIWNSDAFKELRLKMLRGETVPECIKCYEEEKVANSSDRTRSLNDHVLLENICNSDPDSGKVTGLPRILNLKIGNKCNLKCRMCQPLDSAMIDTEFAEIAKTDSRFRSFDNANAFDYNFSESPIEFAGNWIDDEVAKNNLKKLLMNTNHISLAGGETTFTPEAIELLKFCVEIKIANKIEVVMSTNLTRISDELIELMSEFKFFIIVASIDGVENQCEYIRYPSKWSTVKNNFMKIINAPANVIPTIAPTVQIYNILNIVEVFEFVENISTSKWDNTSPCHLTVLFDPQHLSIRHLPKSIKSLAHDRLIEFEKKSKWLKTNKIFKEQFDLLLATLKQEQFDMQNGFSSSDYLSHFLQYTLDLDRKRNQRLEDFIPELHNLLQAEKIVAKYPKEDPRNYTFYRFRDTGFDLANQNKTADALIMFNRAFEMYAEDQDLLFSLGLCHEKLGMPLNAKDFFEKVLILNPQHFHCLIQMGSLLLSENNKDESLNFLNRAYASKELNDSEYLMDLIEKCKK